MKFEFDGEIVYETNMFWYVDKNPNMSDLSSKANLDLLDLFIAIVSLY